MLLKLLHIALVIKKAISVLNGSLPYAPCSLVEICFLLVFFLLFASFYKKRGKMRVTSILVIPTLIATLASWGVVQIMDFIMVKGHNKNLSNEPQTRSITFHSMLLIKLLFRKISTSLTYQIKNKLVKSCVIDTKIRCQNLHLLEP